MNLPPKGICISCEWVKALDGDTVDVRLRTGQILAVRLIGIDCPKPRTKAGLAAKHFTESLFEENGGPLTLWLPQWDYKGDGVLDVLDILTQIIFVRVPGVLFIGTVDVSEILIRHGHAVATPRK